MSRRRRIIIIEGGNAGAIQEGNEESITGPDAEIQIAFDDETYTTEQADAALQAAAAECT